MLRGRITLGLSKLSPVSLALGGVTGGVGGEEAIVGALVVLGGGGGGLGITTGTIITQTATLRARKSPFV